MKAFRLGTRDPQLDPAKQFELILSQIRDCDFAFAWLDRPISRDELGDMLAAHEHPIVILDDGIASAHDSASLSAKYCAGAHYLRSVNGENRGIELAELCVKHACGERICVAFASDLDRCLAASESPIEERLAVHLCAALDCVADVTPQAPIVLDGKKYRADWLITDEFSKKRLIVEADGHEFHERTKEQAGRDKGRDRAMVAAGYGVMRFTGSEIWARPAQCAREVLAFMESTQ